MFTIEAENTKTTDSTTGIVHDHTQGGTDVKSGDDSAQINYSYESDSYNGTGIKKTIEATSVENVFKVSVEVNRKATLETIKQYFQGAGGLSLQSNGSLKNESNGVASNYDPQSRDYHWYGTDQGNHRNLVVTYTLSDGNKFSVTYWQENTSNSGTYHHIIAPLPDGRWLDLYTENYTVSAFISSDTLNVTLNSSVTESLYNAFSVTINSISNTVDLYRFEYLGDSINGTNTSIGVSSSDSKLNATAPDSTGKMNIASTLENNETSSFSYYVSLKADGIDSMKGSNGMPVAQSGTDYPEGTLSANLTLSYTTVSGTTVSTSTQSQAISITKPGVSGVLYYIEVEKVSNEDSSKKLSGATFELRNSSNTAVAHVTTGSNGIGYTDTGVPYGTYTLWETKAPSGYEMHDSSGNSTTNAQQIGTEFNLGYLGDDTSKTWTHDQLGDNKLGKGVTGTNAVKNYPAPISLPVTGGEGSPRWMILAGIVIGGATVAYAIYVGVRDPRRKRGTVRGGGRRG